MKLTKISYISLLIASLVAAPSCTGVLDTPPDDLTFGKHLLAVEGRFRIRIGRMLQRHAGKDFVIWDFGLRWSHG